MHSIWCRIAMLNLCWYDWDMERKYLDIQVIHVFPYLIFLINLAHNGYEHNWDKLCHSDLYLTFYSWKWVCVWSLIHDYACNFLIYCPINFAESMHEIKWGHSDLYFTICSWKYICVWSYTWISLSYFPYILHRFSMSMIEIS